LNLSLEVTHSLPGLAASKPFVQGTRPTSATCNQTPKLNQFFFYILCQWI
jgi:hypothetical protein